MHRIQKQILDLIATHEDFGSYSLRKIATMVGAEGKPQTAKYHLQQLEQEGLIQMNLTEGIIRLVKKGYSEASKSPIYSLPVVGAANCGPATIFAEQNIDQYLKISSSLLPRNKKGLFALMADGDSMNLAKVKSGETIESGDLVLVDKDRSCRNDDIVVAIIDGMATVKRYMEDKEHNRIVLRAESTEKYLPIYLHEGDDAVINGVVVGVIKS